jgi:hypothetical protein
MSILHSTINKPILGTIKPKLGTGYATSQQSLCNGTRTMAQTAKTQPSRLTPSPKALQKALEQSANQAQRLADAFGVVVHCIKPKTTARSRSTS